MWKTHLHNKLYRFKLKSMCHWILTYQMKKKANFNLHSNWSKEWLSKTKTQTLVMRSSIILSFSMYSFMLASFLFFFLFFKDRNMLLIFLASKAKNQIYRNRIRANSFYFMVGNNNRNKRKKKHAQYINIKPPSNVNCDASCMTILKWVNKCWDIGMSILKTFPFKHIHLHTIDMSDFSHRQETQRQNKKLNKIIQKY